MTVEEYLEVVKEPFKKKPQVVFEGVRTAYGYIRVSTDEQAKLGISLDVQKERITA